MHKFYKAKFTAFGPPAVVITTAFRNSGGYFKGESFCVFPAPHPSRAFIEVKFDHKAFNDSLVDLTDEFMMEEALAQANIDLGLHVQDHYSGKELLLAPGGFRLEEVDILFLVHLRVRGAGEFLWDIQNITNCCDLREALEPLFRLPTLTRNKICD